MKIHIALLFTTSLLCAAPSPPKVFKTPVLPVRPARVAFSKAPPPPPFVYARRIDSAGWESSRISPQTILLLKAYPYVISNGKVQWDTKNNSRFRFIIREPDGSWWDGHWTAVFYPSGIISTPMPTNQTWFLVSP